MVCKINLKEDKGNIDKFLFALQDKINEFEDMDESLTEDSNIESGSINKLIKQLNYKIDELEDDNVYDESLTESFTNYDIVDYLGLIEQEWGFDTMDKMLDWLVDHSDNADDILDEYGSYDVEQFDYWIGGNAIEKVMKHCLETGEVEDNY